MLSSEVIVRDASREDLPAFLEIYNDAILNLTATFDIVTQSMQEREDWFRQHGGRYPLVAAEVEGHVVGYCSISPYSKKAGYASTVELSIYVQRDYRRKSIGKLLMKEIIERARELGYHAIISIIAGDNQASVEIHKKFGFELVGHLRQVGYKFSKWQDVDYYELPL